jgi:Holliday junction resolvase
MAWLPWGKGAILANKKINSKRKGAEGERELARKLTEYGYKSRRGQQYNGIEGEDVVGLPGIHIECKRVEKLNLYDAVDQSRWDSTNTSCLPAVFHRKNNHEWLVTMPMEFWIEMYREWSNGRT